MKTPEEIKKGLECCSRSDSCPQECPYYDVQSCGSVSKLDALAYIQQLEVQIPKWISVYDDIPVNENDMLVVNDLNGDMEIYLGWFDGYNGCWHVYGCAEINVTYWMSLPELPKEG